MITLAESTIIATVRILSTKKGFESDMFRKMPLKCKVGETPKQTLNNILNIMVKSRRWVDVSWEQDGKRFFVARSNWFQSGHNFDAIVEIFELA